MSEATFPLAGATPPVIPPAGDPKPIGSGLTDAEGEASGRVDDHCEVAKSKLLSRYKGKPRMEDFLCILADQVTEVEYALWDLFTLRTIDTATGAQLDGIGEIVGEPRKGRTDEVYRAFLRVRVRVNRSDGTVEDLYGILTEAFPGAVVSITEHYPMALQVNLDAALGDVSAYSFVLYLRQAKEAGVKLDFVYSYTDPEDTLFWGSTNDPTLGGEWGSTANPALGDAWAGVM